MACEYWKGCSFQRLRRDSNPQGKCHIGFQDRAIITISVRKQSGVYRIRTCTAFQQDGIATRSDTITATHHVNIKFPCPGTRMNRCSRNVARQVHMFYI